MRRKSAADRIRQIAKQIRAAATIDSRSRWSHADALRTGSRLFVEALGLGALPGDRDDKLRTRVALATARPGGELALIIEAVDALIELGDLPGPRTWVSAALESMGDALPELLLREANRIEREHVKQPRRRSAKRAPRLTLRRQQALAAYPRTGSFEGVAAELGISRQRASTLVKAAQSIVARHETLNRPRSVRASAIPVDARGQVAVGRRGDDVDLDVGEV